MSSKERLFIHVGYPKCASTFFQTKLFPKHNDLDFIGKHNSMFVKNFFMLRESEYDPESIRSFIPQNEKTKIISFENLVGHPFHAHYEADIWARKLHKTFPHAQIILLIRNQIDIIESLFLEWISGGGSGRLGVNSFFKTAKLNSCRLGFSFEYFAYSKLIKYYQKLFGDNNVHVFLFEDFRNNKNAFLESFCGLLGIKPLDDIHANVVRERISPYSYIFLRMLNRYRFGLMNPGGFFDSNIESFTGKAAMKGRYLLDRIYKLMPILGKNVTYMSNKNKAIIRSFYAKDNKILCDILNRDLGALGYPV